MIDIAYIHQGSRRTDTMEKMIGKEVETTAIKYELMSDGIVAEIEDKLFVIFTYGPESRYYLAEIHSGRIVAVRAQLIQPQWRI